MRHLKNLFLVFPVLIFFVFLVSCKTKEINNQIGAYYLYENNNYNKDVYIILDKDTWMNDNNESGSYTISGNSIIFYVESSKEELYSGIIKDGVMILEILGSDVYYCKEGKEPSQNGSDHTHQISAVWTIDKEATCTEEGSKSRHCFNCDKKVDVTSIPATGHNFEDDWTIDKEETCTEEGSKSRHCFNCDEKKDVTSIPATGHSFGNWTTTKDPTETTNGIKERQCRICKYKETDIILAAHIHNYSIEWTIDSKATCTEAGSKSHHCLDCDEKTEITQLDPLGHSFTKSWSYDENYHFQMATCEHIEEQQNRNKHNFVDGICKICSYRQGTNGLAYRYSDDGKGYAVEGIGKATDSDIVIPTIYNGCLVTEIIANCFVNIKRINSIVIPDTVKRIGYSAFEGCTNLTSITIPDSVTSIGGNAFRYCSSLQYNEYDNALYLGNSENPYLWLVKPKNDKITSIIINENTKHIIKYAFNQCYDIESATVPDGLTSIGIGGFLGGSTCQHSEYDNALYLGNSENPYSCLIKAKDRNITSIIINENTKNISPSAFSFCDNLTSITIPNGVTSIGDYAFSECNNLTSVTIPKSVINIGSFVFRDDSNLPSVYYEGTIEDWCKIEFETPLFQPLSASLKDSSNHFYLRNGNEEWTEVTKIEIPNTITEIKHHQFYGFNNVTSISIPSSVTIIGESAFEECSRLESITIPFIGSSLNGTLHPHFGYIFGASTYSDNSVCVPESLKEVIITGGCSIGEKAFYKCYYLKSITIPDSVISIGKYAFRYCSSLKYNEYDNALYLGNSENPYLCLITAKDRNITSCDINENTKSISPSAFENCNSLKYNEYDNALYLGNSENPFLWLVKGKDTNITSCDINENTKHIFSAAFSSCDSLTSITIPFVGASLNGIINTHFGYIFGAKTSSDNSKYVPSSLRKVIITGGTSIGYSAFLGCSSLENITISDSVSSIGEYAFSGCDNLKEIYYSGAIDEWTKMNIGSNGNTLLTSATIYYYSETQPTEAGNYWHYVNGVPTKW